MRRPSRQEKVGEMTTVMSCQQVLPSAELDAEEAESCGLVSDHEVEA